MEGGKRYCNLMYVESWKSNLLRSGGIARYWLYATSVLLIRIMALRSLPHRFLEAAAYSVARTVQVGVTRAKHVPAAWSPERLPATARAIGSGPPHCARTLAK